MKQSLSSPNNNQNLYRTLDLKSKNPASKDFDFQTLYNSPKLTPNSRNYEYHDESRLSETKIKKLENIIEMKEREKEIIIQNYQSLTDKIRGDLQGIRGIEQQLKSNLIAANTENEKLKSDFSIEFERFSNFSQQKLIEKQKEIDQLKKNNDLIENEKNELNMKLQQTQTQLQNLIKDFQKIRIQAHEAEDRCRDATMQATEAQKQNLLNKEDFEKTLQVFRKDFSDLEIQNSEKLNIFEQKIEELYSENKELSQQIEIFKKEIDAKDIENLKLKQKLGEILSFQQQQSLNKSLEEQAKGQEDLKILKAQNHLLSQAKDIMLERLRNEEKDDNTNILPNERNYKQNENEFNEKYLSKKNDNNSMDNYSKTLNNIKELDREITAMNEEYQELLNQSQNTRFSKDKEDIRQKIFYLSDMLRQKTNKMYDLKKEEEYIKKIKK